MTTMVFVIAPNAQAYDHRLSKSSRRLIGLNNETLVNVNNVNFKQLSHSHYKPITLFKVNS